VAVLSSDEPKQASGNVVLDHVLAPEFVWAGPLAYYPLEERIAEVCDGLRSRGRVPYQIPIGGATPVGALGYVDAAAEIVEQLGEVPALTVTADGSGGTHAGLVAGLGDHGRVVGFDVGTRPDLEDVVPREAAATAALAGRTTPVGDVRVDHDYFGADYGAPTDAARAALHLFATCEGLLLDPVYTGKAAAGLVDYARTGQLPEGPIVFVHTGGLPALFANTFAEWVKR
jgi:1-aminocyclopropane-1-carboxylate deaminase/D-cysteine desulfhydrase-like pyridoxal-dependent ACC family enzyme